MAVLRTPSRHVRMVDVARRYYLHDQSKVEIAAELDMSRFKVARLLAEARESGVVTVEITQIGSIRAELSAAVLERLGLAHAVVVELDPDAHLARQTLGAAAADLLTELVTAGDVLGLPWSRGVAAMVGSLRSLPPVPVVQLNGAVLLPESSPLADDVTSVDLVRQAARLTNAPASYFFAPMVAPDRASATVLRRHPSVRRALGQAHRVTIAVVGVGGWGRGSSSLHDALSTRERQRLSRAGVVGEIAGVPFDVSGNRVDTALSDRMITLSYDHLRRIPTVIAIAAGRDRLAAVRAAIAGGLVNGLVCDVELARGLLRS